MLDQLLKLKILNLMKKLNYIIVGSAEADPLNNKISNESPVGSGLIGKKVGEI